MEVPCLIEGGMVAGFCVAALEVKVANVLVGRGVPEEQAGEVVFVLFGVLIPCLLHTDARTKELEVLKVRFDTPPTFKGGDTCSGMYATVVNVDRVE